MKKLEDMIKMKKVDFLVTNQEVMAKLRMNNEVLNVFIQKMQTYINLYLLPAPGAEF
jgi:hypothetical protein